MPALSACAQRRIGRVGLRPSCWVGSALGLLLHARRHRRIHGHAVAGQYAVATIATIAATLPRCAVASTAGGAFDHIAQVDFAHDIAANEQGIDFFVSTRQLVAQEF